MLKNSRPDCPLCDKLSSLTDTPGSELVWQFPHSVAFLGPWQYYRGYCTLVSRRHVEELFELDAQERHAYLEEMSLLASAIHAAFKPDKLNYELLGNQVPHLHWHIFPRSRSEPNSLKPVWLDIDKADRDQTQRRYLEAAEVDRSSIVARLRSPLGQRL
jgi:diadenosine tetraphosphate (Ap4A) HIT family hydrolase